MTRSRSANKTESKTKTKSKIRKILSDEVEKNCTNYDKILKFLNICTKKCKNDYFVVATWRKLY